MITLTQRQNSLMEVYRVWPSRVSVLSTFSGIEEKNTNFQGQRLFLTVAICPSKGGHRGDQEISEGYHVYVRVHSAPVSTRDMSFCLFLWGQWIVRLTWGLWSLQWIMWRQSWPASYTHGRLPSPPRGHSPAQDFPHGCLFPKTHLSISSVVGSQTGPHTGRTRRDGRKRQPLQMGRWQVE